MDEECDRVGRVESGDNAGMAHDAPKPEHRDRDKPDEHDWTERPSDARCPAALHREEDHQDSHRHRHDMRLEEVGRYVETLERAQDRNRGRDDAVAINQRRAEQPHDDERSPATVPTSASQGHQGENAALAMVVGAHHDQTVFDGDYDDQQPNDQRQQSKRHGLRQLAPSGLHNRVQRIERTGAEVAIDDPKRGKSGTRCRSADLPAMARDVYRW